VRWAVQQRDLKFPLTRDITGITFDIINSSAIHDLKVEGRPIRSLIIQLFSECIIRHHGYRESHSGDSAYGHFGLQDGEPSADAALSVANEFRAGLRSLTTINGMRVECGLGLHLIKGAVVDMHTVQMNTSRGLVVQKSFDTTSSDVDLLHRIEKLSHELPGSNVIMSGQFYRQLKSPPEDAIRLGQYQLRGQPAPVELWLLKSSHAKDEHIEALRAQALDAVAKSA
jgi:class 3 adenylate cyclase